MPPLNLGLDGKSEFFRVSGEAVAGKDATGDLSIYSTPRKKAKGCENKSSCDGKNNGDSGFSENALNSLDHGGRSSSRRRKVGNGSGGRNTRNTTPVSGRNRTLGNEDSGVAKDRKSILKQYDPDCISTSTMNIKTPKSQKKVQFGTKNLIIINEGKQNADANDLAEDKNARVANIKSGKGKTVFGQDNSRVSILSELDDPGTGQIYNFPSLEELLNTKKDESLTQVSHSDSGVTMSETLDLAGEMGLDFEKEKPKQGERVVTREGDAGASGSGDEVQYSDALNEVDNSEKSIELTDQLNISDYSITCRDSIVPNVPGAFLSVVMKNLSSVNFLEEGKAVPEEEVGIPELEPLDKNEPSPQNSPERNKECPLVGEGANDGGDSKNFDGAGIGNCGASSSCSNGHICDSENSEKAQLQDEDGNVPLQLHKMVDQLDDADEADQEARSGDSQEVENESESQIVLTETLTILKDNNNRLSNILITPSRSHGNSFYMNKLSPSSEALLNSLNNTKSILNIVPQGYTWEEFQSLFGLNYEIEGHFGILDFEEVEPGGRKEDSGEEGLRNKQLVSEFQKLLERDRGEGENSAAEIKTDHEKEEEKVQKIAERFSEKMIKSIKNQIWDEVESKILRKAFTGPDFYENYTKGLNSFSSGEIGSVLAIIVNKSRYGGKNDEKVKNELIERISRYFFGHDAGNIFSMKAIIKWKEDVVLPLKKLLINKLDEAIKDLTSKQEVILSKRNRIKNSKVLLSTLESCKISEMHVYETYWNAMRIVHENINTYKEEIKRIGNYLDMMKDKKKNVTKLLLKEQELFESLQQELKNWKNRKNLLKERLDDLRIKEEFAGFTWDLFTMNKFQTIVVLNNIGNHGNANVGLGGANVGNSIKTRISIEWRVENVQMQDLKDTDGNEEPPINLALELLDSKVEELELPLLSTQRLSEDNKIYQGYINLIEKTLNLRLKELYLDFKKRNKMNNNALIELIRGLFQSCIVLLWRLESIIFEILNITKVFNLAIIDFVGENQLILNIPVLVGVNDGGENQGFFSNSVSSASASPLLLASSSPTLTPNSLSSTLSPHILMSSRPVISLAFNMANSLFKSVGTLVNSIQEIKVYNMSEELTEGMIRVFREQLNEVRGDEVFGFAPKTHLNEKNSAVYVGYNCLLSIIQNTIQEGGRNQLIWKRPLEKFAPRLLNAVQISKLHQNY
ncbi:hypothetical protein HWI79_3516 [Cryptosporidium felis]|nr:hypothetical protein HWI79_3516 [Cryptosporidium felis]